MLYGSRTRHWPRRRARRWALVLLCASLNLPLALAGCGAGGASATSTPAPAPAAARGALDLVTVTKSPSGQLTSVAHALNLADGAPLWSSQAQGDLGTEVEGGRAVYFALNDPQQHAKGSIPSDTLEALDATTGTLLWRKTSSSGALAPLAATSDEVFVRAFTFPSATTSATSAPQVALAALRASDGATLWSAPESSVGDALIGLDSGALYFFNVGKSPNGQVSSAVYAVSAHDGQPLWTRALPNVSTSGSGAALSGGVLYLAGQNADTGPLGPIPTSVIVAIRARDGAMVWRKAPAGVIAYGAVTITAGMVCFAYTQFNGPGAGLMGLRASDGSLVWQDDLANAGQLALGGGGGALYAQASFNVASWLLAYNAHTGKPVFQRAFPTLPVQLSPGGFEAPPVVVDGTVYLVAQGTAAATGTPAAAGPQLVSVVLAMSASDGGLKWYRALDGFAPGQPLVVVS